MSSVPVEKIIEAVLVFIRIGAILFALPIFGDQPTSVKLRVLLSIALASVVYPIVPNHWMKVPPAEALEFAIVVIKEILIGVLIGYVTRIAFDGLIMAAHICGYQMGFGTAGLLIQDAGAQMSSFEALHRIIVILIFFTLNLHHLFINALFETFNVIPAGGAVLNGGLGQMLIEITANMFFVSIQLAAPILIALTFTMAALGLVARTVPQMNVFTMSFPLSFFIGLITYIAVLPFFPGWLTSHFGSMNQNVYNIIRGLMP